MEWYEIVGWVLTIIFGVLAGVFGTKWKKVKDLLAAVVSFLKFVLVTIPEDGTASPEEMKEVRTRAQAIYDMVRDLLGLK